MKKHINYLIVVYLLSAGILAVDDVAASPLAMTPAQIVQTKDFAPVELAYYNGLTNSDDETNFIETRSWVRLCQQVIDRKLPSSLLPDKPEGFSAKYLLSGEPNVINRAISLQLNPNAVFLEMSPSQILKPADLNPQELAYYTKLTDPNIEKSFIETRSYVRVCNLVVTGKLPALQLPTEPLSFDSNYQLPGEDAIVAQATKACILAKVAKGEWWPTNGSD